MSEFNLDFILGMVSGMATIGAIKFLSRSFWSPDTTQPLQVSTPTPKNVTVTVPPTLLSVPRLTSADSNTLRDTAKPRSVPMVKVDKQVISSWVSNEIATARQKTARATSAKSTKSIKSTKSTTSSTPSRKPGRPTKRSSTKTSRRRRA
jgi:hypothetical protein